MAMIAAELMVALLASQDIDRRMDMDNTASRAAAIVAAGTTP
jgi:hypothetical protein